MVPRRDYKPNTPPHMVGYLREIDRDTLKRYNKEQPDNMYLPGDLVGKQGLELRWEKYLRGKRGYQLIQVDAFGRKSNSLKDKGWNYSMVKAIPGSDLELTIDLELQHAVKKAFNGKYGAAIVLNPNTGAILAAVSEPGFNPEAMQTGISADEWRSLTRNPYKPFLDKTTGGEFAPGSVYKPVLAMAALEEGIITPSTTYRCPGYFKLGNQIYYCHHRGGHGIVNLKKALMKSCDVYFYHIGVELGVDKIASYAKSLGLGQRLGTKLNAERPGLIPTSAWKQLVLRYPWTKRTNDNLDIKNSCNCRNQRFHSGDILKSNSPEYMTRRCLYNSYILNTLHQP
jgi:penicillin-binding protein 2